jgi:DNA-directed RNA polymerase subunit RPC12/RpoP
MSQEYAESLLRSGIIDAKAGQKDSARRYIERAIYTSNNNDHDVMSEAWFWMAQVTDDPVEKRNALENALSHDMYHARARRALAILDGKLKPDEIVNPDNLPLAPTGNRQADADRFMCPKCGGRMVFAPDGSSLVCEYCARNQALGSSKDAAQEQDFIVSMATIRGHSKPLQEQVFHCQGCGAEFILHPDQMSATCAYCGSPHVVKLENVRELIAPEGIIPHAFNQKHATYQLVQWVESNKLKPVRKVELPRGLYLPIWTFDIGGHIDYTGEIIESENSGMNMGRQQPNVVRINDQYPVFVDDLPIPAARKRARQLAQIIGGFNLKTTQPYDARYLSAWPAVVYDVPMGEASLDARSLAYATIKRGLPNFLNSVKIIHTSSASMLVESYKFVLVPAWITEISLEGGEAHVLINGQSGDVTSDLPNKSASGSGLMDWLSDLLVD